MQTVVVDIINEKALHLLKDLERLKLIHVRTKKDEMKEETVLWNKYKGAMSKQSLDEVESQLAKLREEWE